MRWMIRLLIVLAFAGLAGQPMAAPRAPVLVVAAPAQVAAGARIELAFTLRDVADLGGYQATLRFDPAAAHFNGLEHRLDVQRQVGRDIGGLGAVEQPAGITFGAYSCPVGQCVGARQGPRQDRGAAGSVELASVALIADQPGILELALDGVIAVDAAGALLPLDGARQVLRIHVGEAGDAPLHAAPAPAALPAQAGGSAAPGPFDLTGDRRVTHADLIEAALAWTLAQESGAACAAGLDQTRDVNHDGCLDIADIQAIAAQYSAGDSPAGVVPSAGATFTVNSAADTADAQPGDGICATAASVCTLRAAIAEANLASGSNTIAFDIPGSGVHTIVLTQPLPTIGDETGATTIDGYTQPGSHPNAEALLSDAAINVQIKSTDTITPSNLEALHVTSSGNVLRGLALFTFRRSIFAFGPAATDNVIAGNFIGTDAAGAYAAPLLTASGNGIELSQGAARNRIGGSTPAERNVISGNAKNGIATFNGGTDHNLILGNLIGLGPSGQRLHNLSHGIDINSHSSYNIVGGDAPGQRNVVSGNDAEGVEISHGQRTVGNQVIGNFIGTDVNGTRATAATRNGWHGVHIEDGPVDSLVARNVVGNNGLGGISIDGFETGFYPVGNRVEENRVGISLDGTAIPNAKFGVQIADHSLHSRIGPDNIIAFNPIGVQVVGVDTDFNTITQNSIYGNTGLGIDLEPIGAVNPNDAGDADSGADQGLNMAVIGKATPYEITGTTCVTCSVEMFRAAGGTGAYGQGQLFLGAAQAGSNGAFTVIVSGLSVGDYVTATATDALGNTSEFALNVRVVAAPEPIKLEPVAYLPLLSR
jgi:CSLREA domain-containing protein